MAKCAGEVYFFVDEVLGGGEPQSSKTFCLLVEHGGLVPGLAVLVAAAQVGEGKPAALLHPPGEFGVPDGGFREREAAIASHQETLGAVALEALLAGDEHGDAGCRPST